MGSKVYFDEAVICKPDILVLSTYGKGVFHGKENKPISLGNCVDPVLVSAFFSGFGILY
ncbi:protein of unknown function [Brevefilum fermentans]|jgi:hypothetical protein|uniref:Uncharacterized protein n=1 Tax=Candidatus Brevifilum fermentans TaxID=1986204 RepID=A0A1Y6K5L0_9CHLR|nr:protein of unknown function [Brevefilum fermentans]